MIGDFGKKEFEIGDEYCSTNSMINKKLLGGQNNEKEKEDT